MKSQQAMQRLLATVPLFQGLSPDELLLFLSHCRQQEIADQIAVIKEGEHGRHLYAVMSGKLQVQRRGQNGETVELATLSAGDVFGELALIDFGERSASVVSSEPCRLLGFDRLDMVKLPAELAAKLYRNVGTLMAERLRRSNSLVTVLLGRRDLPVLEDETERAEADGNGYSMPKQRVVIRR